MFSGNQKTRLGLCAAPRQTYAGFVAKAASAIASAVRNNLSILFGTTIQRGGL